ncbi:unnamed protein product, partial [Hapterophycus canaliculatus]
MPPVQQWPRRKRNALHDVAECCSDKFPSSDKLMKAVLSRDSIDVNQGDPKGRTPLFLAALNGGSRAVRILLDHGASVAIAADGGVTPLHVCAQEGHVLVKEILVKAGANLDAATPKGSTPLDLAAGRGQAKMIASLVEDGANVNSRLHDRATPLFKAAFLGHLEAVRELLRAKADPLLTQTDPSGDMWVPLDVAAQNGHTAVVGEMVQRLGIKGCGGASRGVDALHMAAGCGHVDVMAILTGAGVVDTGVALAVASETSEEASVKLLLKLREAVSTNALGTYVNNTCGAEGKTPLMCCIDFVRPSSHRVVRRLIDAGADTTSNVPIMFMQGRTGFGITPLGRLSYLASEKKIGTGEDATEEQVLKLEGIRQMLLRVDAVRAISWLWPSDPTVTSVVQAAGNKKSGTKTTSMTGMTSLVLMLPTLRRRNERRGVLLAALCR